MGLWERAVRVYGIDGTDRTVDGGTDFTADAGLGEIDLVPYFGHHVHVEHHLHGGSVRNISVPVLVLYAPGEVMGRDGKPSVPVQGIQSEALFKALPKPGGKSPGLSLSGRRPTGS